MCLNPIYIRGVGEVPCRKCIECRIQFSEDWARRCMLEARKHDKNCFITLTYNDDNLPVGKTLRKRDFQLFMKSLRKKLKSVSAIRFFACGEYGSKGDRPHYHAIIFGWYPDDAVFFKFDNKKNPLYRSKLLESVWKKGFSSVGELSAESAKYCAKYMQGDLMKGDTREPPFTLMSRRPGIALDVIPSSVYKTGDLYYDGHKVIPPRAFLKKVKEDFPEYYELISYKKSSLSKRLTIDFNALENHYSVDDSVIRLIGERFQIEYDDKKISLETRRKKYKKIFENSLDKRYRPVVSLKRKGTMRKSD